jgi:hypothetical protein
MMKAAPWGRILWLLQIVFAGFQALESHERRQAREIAKRVYRDRRLSPKDRQSLLRQARKAGGGAARGARGGMPKLKRR